MSEEWDESLHAPPYTPCTPAICIYVPTGLSWYILLYSYLHRDPIVLQCQWWDEFAPVDVPRDDPKITPLVCISATMMRLIVLKFWDARWLRVGSVQVWDDVHAHVSRASPTSCHSVVWRSFVGRPKDMLLLICCQYPVKCNADSILSVQSTNYFKWRQTSF